MRKLTQEENQFLERLADRQLPEPDRASRDTILSYAAAHIAEKGSTTVRRLPSTERRPRYQQLAGSIIAVSVVLAVLGICWFGGLGPDSPTDPRQQVVSSPNKIKKPQPTEAKVEDLDPMAFDDAYGRLAVLSTKQRIDSFWNEEASSRQSSSAYTVDGRLSEVKSRIEQLKKRSDLDDQFITEPKSNDGGQADGLEAYRYVWFDTPWYLFNAHA